MDEGQRIGVLRIREGLTNGDVRNAGDGDDVTGAGLLCGDALEGLGHEQLGQLDVLDRAVALAPGHRLPLGDLTGDDAAQGQTTEVGGGVEVGDVGAQHPVLLVGGSRNVLEDAVEQRLQVGGVGHPTVLGLVEGGASGLG